MEGRDVAGVWSMSVQRPVERGRGDTLTCVRSFSAWGDWAEFSQDAPSSIAEERFRGFQTLVRYS